MQPEGSEGAAPAAPISSGATIAIDPANVTWGFLPGGCVAPGQAVPPSALLALASVATLAAPSEPLFRKGEQVALVAGSYCQARLIAKDFGLCANTLCGENLIVLHPGRSCGGRRFPLVILTEGFQHALSEAGFNQRQSMQRWLDEDVTMRLSSRDAKIVRL